MKRRKFISTTGKLAISSLFALQCKSKEIAESAGLDNIGIQLYTVRDDMDRDPIGTLKALVDIGFDHVESAGYREGKYYGFTPSQFRGILDDLELDMHSGHISTGISEPAVTHTMTNRWEEVCDHAAMIGQKFIICGWLHENERKSIEDYKRLAETFNKCGEVGKKYGLTIGYHNHDFEFRKMDGQVPYDLLLNETDNSLFSFELDHYWTRKGGVDGISYMKAHPGRFPLWHIKDMEDSDERFFTEVGEGVIDWESIFDTQQDAGLKYFYVEQDHCRNHKPLRSAEIGHDYLAQLAI